MICSIKNGSVKEFKRVDMFLKFVMTLCLSGLVVFPALAAGKKSEPSNQSKADPHTKPAQEGHIDEAVDPRYFSLKSQVYSIIYQGQVVGQAGFIVDLELADSKMQAAVHRKLPLIYHWINIAFPMVSLNTYLTTENKLILVQDVKHYTQKICDHILGPGVVVNILVKDIYEKHFNTKP